MLGKMRAAASWLIASVLVARTAGFASAPARPKAWSLSASPLSAAARGDRDHILGHGDPSHEPTILQQIVEQRRRDVAAAKEQQSVEELSRLADELAQSHGGPIDLFDRVRSEWPTMAIAAEFKRASPSKGDIATDLVAAAQGEIYAGAGAAVISVLTEGKWFKGSLDDLRDVRLSTQALADGGSIARRPAILRKDFIVDEYQLYEARAAGADTVLLIVAVLGVEELGRLIAACRELGMEPLVEVANDEEATIAAEAGARVVGVNNRNLHTFKLDMSTTPRVAEAFAAAGRPLGPLKDGSPNPDAALLALSGITGPADVAPFKAAGAEGLLVGEALMRSSDPRGAIGELLAPPSAGAGAARPLVKVCGLRSAGDARRACEEGASLVGIILAEGLSRSASGEEARAIVEEVRSFGERSGLLLKGEAVARSGGLGERAAVLRDATARRPMVVGVFRDQSADEVAALAAESGVDALQLHGAEDAAFAREVAERTGLPVVKVMHVEAGEEGVDVAAEVRRIEAAAAEAEAAGCALVLLDSTVKGARGGTGVAFDWRIASGLKDRGVPVMVAGGLGKTPGDVRRCLDESGAVGVDASSGLEVEGRPAVKDLDRVAAYVREAIGK